jgi:hypothetical protein
MNNSSAIPRYFNPSAIKRSTLAVILFHSMVNFTEELITLSARADGDSNSQSIASEGNIVDTYKQHSNQNNLNSTQ